MLTKSRGYHSAQSVCESFDLRDLEGDDASQVAEEDVPTRKDNKGGVDPTVTGIPRQQRFSLSHQRLQGRRTKC